LTARYNDGATECKIKIGGKKYKVTNIQGHGDGVRKQVSKKTGEERAVKRSPVGDFDEDEGDSVGALPASSRPSAMNLSKKSGRRSSLAQLAAAGDASLGKAKNVSAGGGMRRSSVMPIKDTTSITKVKMDVAEIESKLGGLRTCVVTPRAAFRFLSGSFPVPSAPRQSGPLLTPTVTTLPTGTRCSSAASSTCATTWRASLRSSRRRTSRRSR
jgi:hypothetical protein